MHNRIEISPCGFCFEANAQVTNERFADDQAAINRSTQLSRLGVFPALCHLPDGSTCVCHCQAPANEDQG